MRNKLIVLMTALFILLAGCTSGSQKDDKGKLHKGEPDPNKHLQGSTPVLKHYRLPESFSKQKTTQSKDAQKNKEEPNR